MTSVALHDGFGKNIFAEGSVKPSPRGPDMLIQAKAACVSRNSEKRLSLFERIPSLRSFFALRVDPDEIDDMMQDVALRLQLCRCSDTIGNGRAYLYRVARSVVIDQRRRDASRHRTLHEPLGPDHDPVEELCPDRVLEGKQQLAFAIDILHELPERTRQVFRLHRFEAMSGAAIARHMGISVSAVEKHIMRATGYLAARLNA